MAQDDDDVLQDHHEHLEMTDGEFGKKFAMMIGLFIILTLALIILGRLMASDVMTKMSMEKQADRDRIVQSRVTPAGKLNIGAVAETAAPAAALTPEEIYNTTCTACHATGVAGAPKLADTAAWAPRIEQGLDTMVEKATAGFQGSTGFMPAKGGNVNLTDDELRSVVEYMVNSSQ